MTQEIKDKIGMVAMQRHPVSETKFLTYKEGAEFGYSLAASELEAANKRIKELEGLLALTESQRKEWADTAIRFKKQIDTPNNIDY